MSLETSLFNGAGGEAFGLLIVFPYGFSFFLGYARENMGSMEKIFGQKISLKTKTFEFKPTLMMGEYFGLVWRMLLAFGLIFELPLQGVRVQSRFGAGLRCSGQNLPWRVVEESLELKGGLFGALDHGHMA